MLLLCGFVGQNRERHNWTHIDSYRIRMAAAKSLTAQRHTCSSPRTTEGYHLPALSCPASRSARNMLGHETAMALVCSVDGSNEDGMPADIVSSC